jgi:predicted O-linked N-acetylglucosamine transferase (SPINDLY family)
VAASLLTAIGLPELITTTRAEYEALAIELANNPQKLSIIKNSLLENQTSTLLFNTPLFVKNLERVYEKMYEKYETNSPPEHIYIY